jgi:hypothetical protein
MSNTNDCNSSELSKKTNDLQKDVDNILRSKDNILRFKDNIAQIAALSSNFLVNLPKNNKNQEKNKFYRIVLTEFDKNNGSCIEYTKEIDSFDYFDLLDDLFNVINDLDYEENDNLTYEDNTIVFNNIEDVINFLKNKKENEK